MSVPLAKGLTSKARGPFRRWRRHLSRPRTSQLQSLSNRNIKHMTTTIRNDGNNAVGARNQISLIWDNYNNYSPPSIAF